MKIVWLCFLIAVELVLASNGDGKSENRLYLLSLLGYPDENASLSFQPSFAEGPSLFLAAQLAVEQINNRSDILEDYRLELIQGDSGCQVQIKTATAFVEHVITSQKQIIGMVGPGCTTAGLLLGPLTGRDRIALINVHIAASPLLEDRLRFPYSFGTLDSSTRIVDGLIALMRSNNWEKVTVLYDESRTFFSSTQQVFEQQVSNLPGYAIEYSSAVLDTYIPLNELQSTDVRIIILLVGPDFVERILCLAYHEGFLFPSYQFIVISETVLVNELTATEFHIEGRTVSCSRENILETVNGSLIISYELSPLNESEITAVGISNEDFNHKYRTLIDEQNELERTELVPNVFASSYHDAVWALGLALNDSIEPLNQINLTLSEYGLGHRAATDIIQQELLELDFVGVSGRIKFNNETGYVRRDIAICQVMNNTQNLVALYNGSTDEIIPLTHPVFINDTFELTISNLHAPLSTAVVFLFVNGIAFILLIVSHILTVVYRKERPIKASQPKLSHLAYVGCHVLVFAIATYVAIESFDLVGKSRCILYHVFNTSLAVTATLLFGVLCAKNWRIYKIFISWKNPGMLISDKFLITFVLSLLSVDILVSIIWILVDPFVVTISRDGDVAQQNCSANYYFLWIGLMFGHNSLILLAAIYFSIRCQGRIPRVQREFQTNFTIILVYALAFTLSLGYAIYFSLQGLSSITLEFTVLCLTLTVGQYLCLVFMFLPPVIQMLKPKLKCNDTVHNF